MDDFLLTEHAVRRTNRTRKNIVGQNEGFKDIQREKSLTAAINITPFGYTVNSLFPQHLSLRGTVWQQIQTKTTKIPSQSCNIAAYYLYIAK